MEIIQNQTLIMSNKEANRIAVLDRLNKKRNKTKKSSRSFRPINSSSKEIFTKKGRVESSRPAPSATLNSTFKAKLTK